MVNTDKIAISSDWHMFHENIIKYCNRPFQNVEEMNREIIRGVHKKLPEGGTLYFVGDFAMGGIANAIKARQMINEKIDIVFLIGNHESHYAKKEEFRNLFKSVQDYLKISINKQQAILFHYKLQVWDGQQYGAYHCFAHSHNGIPDNPNERSLDIGIDSYFAKFGRFEPFLWKEVVEWMDKKKSWGVEVCDHHRRNMSDSGF